jgi:hypothetical protein
MVAALICKLSSGASCKQQLMFGSLFLCAAVAIYRPKCNTQYAVLMCCVHPHPCVPVSCSP